MKNILLGFVLIFLLIQIIQPARNIDYGQVPSTDISKVYKLPANVQSVLRNSCYDCHSNSTHYPFYSYIQPLSYYLEKHIKKGKEELNFNEWGSYSRRKQANKLESIVNQIQQKKMPLTSYTYLHPEAKLSEKQIEEIVHWIELTQAEKEK
ncbi:Haem-binding domain-containing protein [Chryseobacterium rhizoplanae]|uniref:Haem-binding domain-containing protein n=1 Tax=Chryseobacterium rhizoplanae TaxID=1609531 RepID=A0A521CZS1_9FLAO|nr:heme-binding domain-containing protein [Chryseobacterium rhizoplanae]SMO64945.1 Haem-binding domain-containing protein [Chryseobacterium rhizoplanae]